MAIVALTATMTLAVTTFVAGTATAVTTGNGSLVYAPPDGSSFTDEGCEAAGTAYAKIVALKHNGSSNGTLIATFDDARLIKDRNPSSDPTTDTQDCLADASLACHQEWPIFRSTDGGTSWQKVAAIDPGTQFPGVPGQEDPTQLDRTAQPFLYELPQAMGGLPAGTILLSGKIRPADRYAATSASKLVVYQSQDQGATWSCLSTIDTGGPAVYDPSPTSTTTEGWTGARQTTSAPRSRSRTVAASDPRRSWVPTGGPHGMVVVASKWGLDENGHIYQGQNFFVNYNLGDGPWERLPFAVTFDGPSSITGFAQGIDYGPDGQTLYQATNVDNYRTNPSDPSETFLYNDIRVGTIPLNATAHEAENAAVQNTTLVQHGDASNGSKVGNINYSDSTVTFTVQAPQSGSYTVNVRYANGTSGTSSHAVSVNSGTAFSVGYPTTTDWGRHLWAQFDATLSAGSNPIQFSCQGTYAELDQIQVCRGSVAADPEFHIVNRNSGKLLEIDAASAADGATAVQWGPTGHATQEWSLQREGVQ